MIDPTYSEKFESRHNAPNAKQIAEMLKVVKAKSVDEVIDQTVPANIRLKKALNLPAPQSEFEFLKEFKRWCQKIRFTNRTSVRAITIASRPV